MRTSQYKSRNRRRNICSFKIISDFKVHMNVIRNKKFVGFQEFIEGQNGVVNCLERLNGAT
jgi:hypothetical protein